jgi:hypothetical protein
MIDFIPVRSKEELQRKLNEPGTVRLCTYNPELVGSKRAARGSELNPVCDVEELTPKLEIEALLVPEIIILEYTCIQVIHALGADIRKRSGRVSERVRSWLTENAGIKPFVEPRDR